MLGGVAEACGLAVAAALLGLAAPVELAFGAGWVAVGLAELPWQAANNTAASAN